jgi:lipoate-protein ligase A
VAGGAQRRSAAGILYQGSIYLGNLPDMDRETTRAALEAGFTKGLGCRLRSFEQPPDLVAVADGLVASRFGTDAWNRKR